jgi:hypothetical protein
VSRPLLQRVGEEKIGVAPAVAKDAPGMVALTEALNAVRDGRKAAKDKYQRDELSALDTLDEKVRKNRVMGEYPTLLAGGDPLTALTTAATARGTPDEQTKALARIEHLKKEYPTLLVPGDRLKQLEKTRPFVAGELKLSVDRKQVLDRDGKLVADLTAGRASYTDTTPADAAATVRKTFTRNGKQYVADDRDVPTRRFAFVEKSIYQFMELLGTGTMTGRYQSLQYSLGETPLVKQMIAHESTVISTSGRDVVSTLNLPQLAVLHQWQGSGMNQRGLSLTSTPRTGAVFGNAGDSFRSADGVRMKIDLALVPKDVVLLNHYSSGGVKDDVSTVNPSLTWTGRRNLYNYGGSATKNRELLLERLDPAWITDIEVHSGATDKPKPPAAAGKAGADLLEAIKGDVGHADYVAGFKTAVEGKPEPPSSSAIFTKGFKSGELYNAGHADGRPQRTAFETKAREVRAAIVKAHTDATSTARAPKGPAGRGWVAPPPTAADRLAAAKAKAKELAGGLLDTTPRAEKIATKMICDTTLDRDLGYDAMRAIALTGWLALTSFSREDRDKKDIYWVGWSHSARNQPKRTTMDRGFYTLA